MQPATSNLKSFPGVEGDRITVAEEFDTDRPRLSLDGTWEFSFDPQNIGTVERWFDGDIRLPESIRVPGCAQVKRRRSAAGGTRHVQGETESLPLLRYPCTHDGWHKKRFEIPAAWRGEIIRLHIGGVLPGAEFWINGYRLGWTNSSRCALRCDLTSRLKWDRPNTLTVRVTRPEKGLDGLHELYGWSGIYRSCWIERVPSTHFTGIQVQTSIRPAAARFRLSIATGAKTADYRLECRVTDTAGKREYREHVGFCGKTRVMHLEVRVAMPGASLWSPETPHLYRAEFRLLRDGKVLDTAMIRFGLRSIVCRGRQILLNGTPIFLRGGCDDQLYPHTICPPADIEFFRDRIARAKAYGFNYTKSCVEVFTREFLDAADELGYMVCQEMPFGLSLARNRRYDPPAWFPALCRRELDNLIRFERHHPCIVSYSMASELDARWLQSRRTFHLFSRDLPRRTRQLHPETLIFDCTGESGSGPDFPTPMHTALGRRDADLQSGVMRDYCEGFCPLRAPYSDFRNVSLPFLLHEYSWITSLSDPGLIRRYRSLPMRPWRVPEMIAAARANGLGRLLPRMVECSRRLKLALRKDALEQARRAPQIAGYHHWLIHDFPFCAEGVFNEFWEYPTGLPPARFRAYNDDTVLLLEDRNRRSFAWGERIPMAIRVAHHGREPLRKAVIHWRLDAGRRRLAAGMVHSHTDIQCGDLTDMPDLGIVLPRETLPARLRLSARLAASDGRVINRNEWNLWAFPEHTPIACRSRIVTSLPWAVRLFKGIRKTDDPAHAGARIALLGALDEATVDYLAGGGRVLLIAPGPADGMPGLLPRGQGKPAYRSVEFNCGRFGNMGTVIRAHAALGRLPHNGWCDLCFAPLIEGAYPFALHPFGRGRVNPIIRSIGHMATMEDKAYLFDVAVGRGILLACSLRLGETANHDPLARYLAVHLVAWLDRAVRRPIATISARRLAAMLSSSATS